jgi:hypothetical protein
MKKQLGILALAVLVISVSVASADDFTTSVNAGSKAMLFEFSGLSALAANAYQGGIGGKYYLLDPLALRASLLFGFADQGTPAPAAGGSAGDANAFSIGLNAGAEYHLLKTRVSPYVGGTLGFVSTSTSEKDAVATGVTAPTTTNAAAGQMVNGVTYFSGFGFNVAAIAGVEFFIIKELSLSAEYRLGYGITAPYDEKQTTGAVTVTTKSGARQALGITSVGAFSLAFYF